MDAKTFLRSIQIKNDINDKTPQHNLRNLLYIMQAQLDLFEQKVSGRFFESNETMVEESCERIQKIRANIIQALDITKRMGTLGHARNKRGMSTSIDECAACVVACLEERLDNTDLRLEIPEKLPNVRLQKKHLKEILYNLMENALDAMPLGGILEVKAVLIEQEIKLSVSDTGRGITHGIFECIFDPFFTTKERGTGLGLFIVKRLVEHGGGKIECISAEGKGTSFELRLPVSFKNENGKDGQAKLNESSQNARSSNP